MKTNQQGFTLIELMVVIAIIAMLSSIVLVSLGNVRSKARDVKRLGDMKQVQIALEFYLDKYGQYPTTDGDGAGGWDVGNQDLPFLSNMDPEFMSDPPEDPTATGDPFGYQYYRYPPGGFSQNCDISRGGFYVLRVYYSFETISGIHPDSPGWACGTGNWQPAQGWVTGKFEK